MAHIQRILVPSDGSPPSLAALQEASLIADELGASIELLHVRSQGTSAARSVLSAAEEGPDELEHAFTAAKQRLGPRIDRRTEDGDPLRTILALASSGDYDLIVMGTHGRVGRLHALLGSVAEGVVRSAPCPVLTVRAPDGQESFSERRHRRASIAEQPR